MLAQFPLTTTGGSVVEWSAAAAAVVWIASTVLKAVNEYKRHAQGIIDSAREFVTRAEFDRAMQMVEADREGAVRTLSMKIDKHEEYTHKRMHELSDAIHTVTLKLAEQPQMTRLMVDAAVAPLQRKLDSLMMSQAAMCAKLEIELPKES